jgi:hypothetical protein
MVFVRLVAHINHNWRLLNYQRAFSLITGMLDLDTERAPPIIIP